MVQPSQAAWAGNGLTPWASGAAQMPPWALHPRTAHSTPSLSPPVALGDPTTASLFSPCSGPPGSLLHPGRSVDLNNKLRQREGN